MFKQKQQQLLDEMRLQGATRMQLQQDPASGDASQHKSSMASTGVRDDEAPMDRYPVDDIRDMTNCELHQSMKNISMKVVVSFALPCEPRVRWHGHEIQAGYARVGVDEVVLGYDSLDLTSLDLKRRWHLEKSWVISFYGIIKTSYFQARRQGGHRLL
jgi:hypothetical protein